MDWYLVSSQLYFTINLEEIFYFNNKKYRIYAVFGVSQTPSRDLRGKELGEGIYQQTNGKYCARFVDRFGKRKSKRSKKLQGVRQWLAHATYINEHSDLE